MISVSSLVGFGFMEINNFDWVSFDNHIGPGFPQVPLLRSLSTSGRFLFPSFPNFHPPPPLSPKKTSQLHHGHIARFPMFLEHQFFLGRGAATRVALLSQAVVAAPDGAESPVPEGSVVGEVMLE